MLLPVTPFACLVMGVACLGICGFTVVTAWSIPALLAVGVVFGLLGLGLVALGVLVRRTGRGWFER
ncbi:hypothetical protein [Actinocatenispora rupis]|uniref:Uncharacterized protein n=1 Tax=Actinocatenispora rupis TaxID=519421 RepID=A0A8J3J7T5_9ACTN|nr:hypothetical protein [Actinocatenispora rupis]GID10978.1 hypothetical protein Aru02nite_18670 [Actinocatenispora rupis]